jgi:hypothetical protein
LQRSICENQKTIPKILTENIFEAKHEINFPVLLRFAFVFDEAFPYLQQ